MSILYMKELLYRFWLTINQKFDEKGSDINLSYDSVNFSIFLTKAPKFRVIFTTQL